MGTYILRRLLLMVPTVIGMTLLVFLLVAASPGGIGAALNVSGGGQMESGTSKAQQQAYLEDRYGLDAPVVVQYLRWLGRVSPVKFGQRDLVAPTGEVIRSPRPIEPPMHWESFVDALPSVSTPPEPFVFPSDVTDEDRSRAYRRASQGYTRVRAEYVLARAGYEQAIGEGLRAVGLDRHANRDGTMKGGTPASAVRAVLDDPEQGELARAAFGEAIEWYEEVIEERRALKAVFDARPFPPAGFPLIPGVVSVATPDLGMSFARGRPVSTLIGDALPKTLLLNFMAIPIIYFIAVPSGMLAATRRGGLFDVLSGGLYVALWSIPIVWACVLMLGFLANKETGLGWFPVTGLNSIEGERMTWLPDRASDGTFVRGFVLDTLWHMCLPVAALVYAGFAVLSKQTRAAMLDNFNADYVRTAKAKGVRSRDVVLRHVFRNSLLPIITMFVSIFPAMLGGSVVVERVFSVPGMGNLVIDAIFLRDREVLLANALIIGLVNMLALLLADVLYALADPRVSYD
ncbi:MAG: ABC transporter permease [Planctomycetota bacterium]